MNGSLTLKIRSFRDPGYFFELAAVMPLLAVPNRLQPPGWE